MLRIHSLHCRCVALFLCGGQHRNNFAAGFQQEPAACDLIGIDGGKSFQERRFVIKTGAGHHGAAERIEFQLAVVCHDLGCPEIIVDSGAAVNFAAFGENQSNRFARLFRICLDAGKRCKVQSPCGTRQVAAGDSGGACLIMAVFFAAPLCQKQSGGEQGGTDRQCEQFCVFHLKNSFQVTYVCDD